MAKTNKGRKLFATTATAALVASAIVPVASAAQVNDFNSISSYAQEAVQSLVDRGVVQGDAKGNFNPRNSVTRAEAATILVGALDLDATGSINFTDVKAGAWYYDAINAAVNNNVFQGQGAGKFNPSGNLTRSEAAIILVNAFGLEGSGDLSEFSDASSVKTWAKEALEIAVANGVMKGDNGKLNPNANITKQDFAVMFYRTEVLEAAPVTGAVKAINNTTVEVTFEDVIADVNALKFTIDGLEVTNAVVKQTDSKTVVLTTAAQTADTTYKVSVDGKEVGSFKGVSAVIPTAVKTVVASQQGVIGKEVTLSAEVTVAEGQSKAGIPVTFNIITDAKNNAKIEVEAITNDKGVATYSYTRYYAGEDNVVAYATSKSSVKDDAKVYWASSAQLTIKEAKEGNTVANNSKKVYEITGDKNSVVFVAFEENLNVKSNKVVDVAVTSAVGYIDEKDDYTAYKSTKDLTPYEISTGDAQYVVIELDSKGKGSLIITGEDASVTPIVYKADFGKLNLKKLDENQEDVAGLDVAYNKLLLQDKAATVKFDKNDILGLEVKALGTEDAAAVKGDVLPSEGKLEDDNGLGGRKYEVTVKNKAGEVAAAGTTAYVTFGDFEGKIQVIIGDKVTNVKAKEVYEIKVAGKEGKASFRVIGTGKKAYVTPTVFLNTEGSTSTPALDKKDIQAEAETTYFTAATVKEAVLTVEDEKGNEVTSLQADQKAVAVYQSVDQNGFAYGTGKVYDVTFELTTTFGELKVDDEEKVQNVGKTYTYETKSDSNGRAEVKFTAKSATTVEIDILGSRNVLPAKAATVKFTQFATGETTGVATAVDTDKKLLTIKTATYNYAGAAYKYQGSTITRAAFEDYIKGNLANVSVTKDAEGNLTFNVLSVGAAANSKEALHAAITAATAKATTAVPGSAEGQYPAAAITALNAAITAATTVFNNNFATPAQVETAVKDLATAVATFDKAVVGNQKAALTTKVTEATALAATLTAFSTAGTPPLVWGIDNKANEVQASTLTALNTAITTANVLLADTGAVSADFAAQLTALNTAITNIKTDLNAYNTAKAALQNAITIAERAHTAAKTGLGNGMFAAADKAALLGAINTAKAVVDGTTTTVANLTAALTPLNTAKTTFDGTVIAHDVTPVTTAAGVTLTLSFTSSVGTVLAAGDTVTLDSASTATATAASVATADELVITVTTPAFDETIIVPVTVNGQVVEFTFTFDGTAWEVTNQTPADFVEVQ